MGLCLGMGKEPAESSRFRIREAKVTLQQVSVKGHLTWKNQQIRPLQTPKSSLKFPGPGPHAGLQPPQYLLTLM